MWLEPTRNICRIFRPVALLTHNYGKKIIAGAKTMSKFRRVEDTQNVPQYIEERFAGTNNDPYKELRKGRQERQMKIASQELGARRVATSRVNEWEHTESQSEFEQPSMMREFDEQLSRFSAADLNPNSVRRLDTGYDSGLNTRSAGNQLFVTETDALDLIRRGASIWNPDFQEVSRVCNDTMSEHDNLFQNQEKRRSARTENHKKWERKASRREMMGRTNVLDRAGAVVRNSFNNEYVSESSFGLPNYNAVIADEEQRMKRTQESRESRLELKRRGCSPEEKQESWEEHAQRAVHAARFQDQNIDWVDKYVRRYDEDTSNDTDLSQELRRK